MALWDARTLWLSNPEALGGRGEGEEMKAQITTECSACFIECEAKDSLLSRIPDGCPLPDVPEIPTENFEPGRIVSGEYESACVAFVEKLRRMK